MLGNISIKILYQNCDTFLQVSLKRKDQINENHLQFVNNNTSQGVMNVRWEKTATRNVLKYDATNMTALSEYIKQTLSQDKYFELVSQVQKILEFCNDSNLPVNNLILNDPKNVYYNVEEHKIYVAYLPLMENNYSCSNIVKFLSKLNKRAKISVTNGNMMSRYTQFLDDHMRIQKGKSDKNSCCTYNHLYNFLHDVGNARSEVVPSAVSQPAPVPVAAPEKSQAVNTVPKQDIPEDDGDHTILVSHKVNKKCEVFLTDESGREYPLDHFPFTIGRKKENDLSLAGNRTVSGEHAAILCENGEYFIEDRDSGNGTFLNQTAESGKKITKEKLRNGDVIYIYDVALKFNNESEDSGTYIVGTKKTARAEKAEKAVPEEKPKEPAAPVKDMYTIAYLVNNSSNEKIPVYSYPFTCSEVSGIMIGQDNTGSRHSIYIKNITCDSLSIEGSNVETGGKIGIFSGCNFLYHGITYTFYEEN